MIEIKFQGGYGGIIDEIKNFLKQAEGEPEPEPMRVKHLTVQSESDGYQHVVALVEGRAISCTCKAFRFAPLPGVMICKHMEEAQEDCGCGS